MSHTVNGEGRQQVERRRPCPQCGLLVGWRNNAFRPFCSQRCKLIDLGAWIEERYAIPGEEVGADSEAEQASPADETPEE